MPGRSISQLLEGAMAIACVTHFARGGQPLAVVVREWRFGLQSVLHAQHERDLRQFQTQLRSEALDAEHMALRFIEFVRAQRLAHEEVLLYPTAWHPDLAGLQPFVVEVAVERAQVYHSQARL
jgi:hypothetical protein